MFSNILTVVEFMSWHCACGEYANSRSIMESMLRPLLDELLSPFLNKLSDTSTCFNDTNTDTVTALRDCNQTMKFTQMQLETLDKRFDTVEKAVTKLAKQSETETKLEPVKSMSIPCVSVVTPKKKPLILPVMPPGAIANHNFDTTKTSKSIERGNIVPVPVTPKKVLVTPKKVSVVPVTPKKLSAVPVTPNKLPVVLVTPKKLPVVPVTPKKLSVVTPKQVLAKPVTPQNLLAVPVTPSAPSSPHLPKQTLTVYKPISKLDVNNTPVTPQISCPIPQKKIKPPKTLDEILDDTVRRVQANTATPAVSIGNKSEFLEKKIREIHELKRKRELVENTVGPTQARKRQHVHQQKAAATEPKRPMMSSLLLPVNSRTGFIFPSYIDETNAELPKTVATEPKRPTKSPPLLLQVNALIDKLSADQ